MASKSTLDQQSSWQLAAEWLLSSGIQDTSNLPKYHGGVNAWYDLRKGTYPFIYSEITGYAVNAYLFFHEKTGDTNYLEAAKLAGDWLCTNREESTKLVPTRMIHSDDHANYFASSFFLFDEWIIAYGLGCLAEVTEDEKYRGAAKDMIDFLIKKNSRQDGSFEPLFNLETNKAEGFGDKWSRQPGSYHAKHLMALYQLHKITNENHYLEVAEKLASWTINLQKPDGRYVTQDSEDSTHLHPHLYTLEGLLSFGLNTENKGCIDSALRGLQWILSNQNENGGVYCWFIQDKFSPFERVDVLAQTLRVGAALKQFGYLNEEESASLDQLRNHLLTYQLEVGEQKGAFLYGQEETGAVHYHANAWVTMFASQALWMYEQSDLSSPKLKMEFFA